MPVWQNTGATVGQIPIKVGPSEGDWGAVSPSAIINVEGAANRLIPVGPQTANYQGAPNEYALFDTSNATANLAFTFPLAPTDGTLTGLKIVKQDPLGANGVTYATGGGSDVINIAGGVKGGTIVVNGQDQVWQYVAAGAIWVVISDDLPLSRLDARYAPYTPTVLFLTQQFR